MLKADLTSRPPVPMGVYQESFLDFFSEIKRKNDDYSIPRDLVLNADQTPSKYVSTGFMTMAKRREKSVTMKGLSDKKSITLKFTVSLAGEFPSM